MTHFWLRHSSLCPVVTVVIIRFSFVLSCSADTRCGDWLALSVPLSTLFSCAASQRKFYIIDLNMLCIRGIKVCMATVALHL